MEFRAQCASESIFHPTCRFCVKYCTTFGVYALSAPEWKQVNIIAVFFKPYKDATMILQASASHLGD
ncbi:hypothetical protein BT69DRAFT_1281005, partial [Atractiella rhizophila]